MTVIVAMRCRAMQGREVAKDAADEEARQAAMIEAARRQQGGGDREECCGSVEKSRLLATIVANSRDPSRGSRGQGA